MGERAAYVRQRGFEPLQQEQMVLQYVEKHGRTTRREVAELCRVSSDQAKRILVRLVKHEELVPEGQRKGRYYTRAPKNMGAPNADMGAPRNWGVRPNADAESRGLEARQGGCGVLFPLVLDRSAGVAIRRSHLLPARHAGWPRAGLFFASLTERLPPWCPRETGPGWGGAVALGSLE